MCARVSSVPVSMKHHYSICVVILCCIDFSPPLRQVKESILTLISLVCMHLHFNHYAGQSWSAVLAARFLCLCFVLNWAQLKLVHMSVLPLSLSAGDMMMVLIYISSCIRDGGWGLSGWSGCWRVFHWCSFHSIRSYLCLTLKTIKLHNHMGFFCFVFLLQELHSESWPPPSASVVSDFIIWSPWQP